MISNDTYIDDARRLVDHFWWTASGQDEAIAAVEALDPDSAWAQFLMAQVAYTRLLFQLDPRPEDRAVTEKGFRAAAADAELHGWGLFWLGIFADNVEDDAVTAGGYYRQALAASEGDLFLESYVVRHLGGHAADAGDLAEARRLFRRSLHLRSALGRRPQVAAAQVALAEQLDLDDPERGELLYAARHAAAELELTWLKGAIAEMEAAG